MKKNKSKLVILFMLLLAMLVSGCGAGINKGNDIKEKTDQENDSDQTNRSAAKYSWKDKHISLDRQYQAVTVTEDKIYGCSEDKTLHSYAYSAHLRQHFDAHYKRMDS